MKNKKLYCQNRADWDEVKVWSEHHKKNIPALRINVDKMDQDNQQLLSDELQLLRIDYRVRRATRESEHVKEGDKTVRVVGAANIERLSKLFGEDSTPDKDWRNLKNWDDKQFYINGFVPVKGKCYNLKDKTEEEIQHIRDVFDDLNIHYGVRTASKATERIDEGDLYLRVTGDEEVQKLINFTDIWTPKDDPFPLKLKKREGSR